MALSWLRRFSVTSRRSPSSTEREFMKSSAKPCSVKRKKTFASALNPTKYLGLTRWVSSDRCFSAQDWLDCKHSSIEPFWLYSKEVAADKTYCAICENNFIFKFLFISSRPVLSHRALVVLCGHTSQLDRQTRLMFCQPWPAFFFVSLRHFGHLSRNSIEARRNSILWPKK